MEPVYSIRPFTFPSTGSEIFYHKVTRLPRHCPAGIVRLLLFSGFTKRMFLD
jgi:hypothetical protein